MTDIISQGASALSRMIRTRQVSCREVMALTLDRIAQKDATYNAVPILRPRDALMAEAAAYDEELARGAWRGWLHGIPQAVKDLASVKGMRTTWGSPLFKDFVAPEDSIHVARARRGRDHDRQDQHAGVRTRLALLQPGAWRDAQRA